MLKKTFGAAFQKLFRRGGLFHDQTIVHEQWLSASSAAGVETHKLVVGYTGGAIPFGTSARPPFTKSRREILNRHSYFFLRLQRTGQSFRYRKFTYKISYLSPSTQHVISSGELRVPARIEQPETK